MYTSGHGFGWTVGVGDGQGGLACCGSWGCKESDTTKPLNWRKFYRILSFFLQTSLQKLNMLYAGEYMWWLIYIYIHDIYKTLHYINTFQMYINHTWTKALKEHISYRGAYVVISPIVFISTQAGNLSPLFPIIYSVAESLWETKGLNTERGNWKC